MAVPVSNARRLICAAKRTGVSPTILRAALLREAFNPPIVRPLWNALADEAGIEGLDNPTRQALLDDLLHRSAEEIATMSAEVVADILTRRAALLEGTWEA